MVNQSTAPIPLDLRPFDVAMSEDGSTLYVCSGDEAGCVFLLDTATHTVRKKIDCPDANTMVLAPGGRRLYVTNREGQAVTVIDTAPGAEKVTGSIAMPGVPFDLAVLSTGTRIYAAIDEPASVAVIDTATAKVIRSIRVGDSVFGLAVSPDDSRVYVTDFGGGNDGALHVIRTATDTVDGTPVPVRPFARAAAVTPDGSRIFVLEGQDGTVSVVDAASRTVIDSIRVGSFPKNFRMDPGGRRLYTGNAEDNTVSVIDTGTLRVTRTLLVDGPPANLVATPDGHRLYAAAFRERSVLPVDARTVTLRTGKRPEAALFTGNGRLCVTNPGDGTVTVLRTEPVAVTVGPEPVAVAVAADGRTAYVANALSNDVSVIDTATDRVTATIGSVPVGPAGVIALAPDGRRLYVAGPDRVTAVDTTTRTVAATVPVPGLTGMAMSPDGLRLYVTDGDRHMFVLSTNPFGLLPGTPSVLGDNPLSGATDVAVTNDGRHVYVPDTAVDRVMVMDTTTLALTTIFPLAGGPRSVAMSPVERRAYIACENAGTVVTVDTNSHTVVGQPLPLPFAIGDLAISRDGTRLYALAMSGPAVVVVDTATHTRLEALPTGNDPFALALALTPDGRRAYVPHVDSSTVTVVDTNTTRIRLGGDPTGLAATSGGDLAYVAVPASGTVAVIDTVTGATAGPAIPVGGRPKALALTADDKTLYVAGPGAVTVVDTATRTVRGAPIPVGDLPEGLALTTDGSRLYVADSGAARSP